MSGAHTRLPGNSGHARLPVVGVMGSGVRAHRAMAAPLGRGLARMGVHLLTGGGAGVMESVSRAFAEVEGRAGLVVGVLPGDAASVGGAPPGYPNPWVELAVRTHLDARGAGGSGPLSRNQVNILSSDVVVALPGGEGTASEVALALGYGRPLVLLGNAEGRAREAEADVKGDSGAGRVHAVGTPEEALSRVRRLVARVRRG